MHFDISTYSGNEFFFECISVYNSTLTNIDKLILLGYVLLTIICCIKGTKKERIFFGCQPLVLFVFILNPWSSWILVKMFGLETRYFRFFWLLPVCEAYSYVLTKFYAQMKNKSGKIFMNIVITVLVLLGISQANYILPVLFKGVNPKDGIQIVDNRYKVQDDVVEAASIIEEDKASMSEEVNVLYDYNMYIEIRTFDASIIPVVKDSATQQYYNLTVEQSELDDLVREEKWTDVENIFMNSSVASADNYMMLDIETMKKALYETKTDYIVVPTQYIYYKYWLEMGSEIGQTKNYAVIRVE